MAIYNGFGEMKGNEDFSDESSYEEMSDFSELPSIQSIVNDDGLGEAKGNTISPDESSIVAKLGWAH